MILTLVVSGKNATYNGGQREECSLHWWSVGRMILTSVVIGKNAPLHLRSMGRMFLTLVVSGKNALYLGGQWKECSVHSWLVGRLFLTLVVSKKNVPYMCD
ncbi:unnamed protein product [Staurois parvus]|uniref:Uncharacterized protein n=1 Tax=Staurois parvus TaxID=386267 RepID=A0ABN9HB63_9NEOB|nr:unnamed protein product [Staurois parvus]